MKNNKAYYKAAFGCMIAFFCYSLSAQNNKISFSENSSVYETQKRADHYMELKTMGYSEKEIFEDLGNANFLAKNFQTALFWYDELKGISKNGTLSKSYDQRYKHALKILGGSPIASSSNHEDWLATVKEDYEIDENFKNYSSNSVASNYKSLDPYIGGPSGLNNEPVSFTKNDLKYIEKLNQGEANEAPITLTADGKTAFFGKTVYIKPSHGILSKKEPIHKIYKASKINGLWENIQELKLCPKYSSVLHPAVSYDGKRLFFASDMPGTLGKYDIYVSAISSNGTIGIAKNLGEKVNTKKNDLYPNFIGSNTLFFASEGREGHGGLDVYMAQVDHNKVGFAVNLGSPINSKEDDFSISFKTQEGMGYVMSNRGKNKETVRQVAFSYGNKNKKSSDPREYNILAVLQSDLRTDYSSSVFEEE